MLNLVTKIRTIFIGYNVISFCLISKGNYVIHIKVSVGFSDLFLSARETKPKLRIFDPWRPNLTPQEFQPGYPVIQTIEHL